MKQLAGVRPPTANRCLVKGVHHGAGNVAALSVYAGRV